MEHRRSPSQQDTKQDATFERQIQPTTLTEQLTSLEQKRKIASATILERSHGVFEYKNNISTHKNKAVVAIGEKLHTSNSDVAHRIITALEDSDPMSMYDIHTKSNITAMVYYGQACSSDALDKMAKITQVTGDPEKVIDAINRLSFLGYHINPTIFGKIPTQDLLFFAQMTQEQFMHTISQLDQYHFLRGVYPIGEKAMKRTVYAEYPSPELAEWKEIFTRSMAGQQILTEDQQQGLNAALQVSDLTSAKAFTMIDSPIFSLTDITDHRQEWQNATYLLQQMLLSSNTAYANLITSESFPMVLKDLIFTQRINMLVHIIQSQEGIRPQNEQQEFVTQLTDMLVTGEYADEFHLLIHQYIETSSLSESDKDFWKTAYDLYSPAYPELYNNFLATKSNWNLGEKRRIILDTWTKTKQQQGIVINNGHAIVTLLENAGPSSNLLKELVLGDIVAAVILGRVNDRADIEVISSKLRRVLQKYDYLHTQSPIVRFLLNYAVQNLPFGMGQGAIIELRNDALLIANQGYYRVANASSIYGDWLSADKHFVDNPFEWIHQAVHNQPNPLNLDLFQEYMRFLQTGEFERFDRFLHRKNDLGEYLINEKSWPPMNHLQKLTNAQRRSILNDFEPMFLNIQQGLQELYKPNIQSLINRFQDIAPYFITDTNLYPTVVKALQSLQQLEQQPDSSNIIAYIQEVIAARKILREHLDRDLFDAHREDLAESLRQAGKRGGAERYYLQQVYGTLVGIDQRLDMTADLLFSHASEYITQVLREPTLEPQIVHQATQLAISMVEFLDLSGISMAEDPLYTHITPLLTRAESMALTNPRTAFQLLGFAVVLAAHGYEKAYRDITASVATSIAQTVFIQTKETLGIPDDDEQDLVMLWRQAMNETHFTHLINVYKSTSMFPILSYLAILQSSLEETVMRIKSGDTTYGQIKPVGIEQLLSIYHASAYSTQIQQYITARIGNEMLITEEDLSNLSSLDKKLKHLEGQSSTKAYGLLRLIEGQNFDAARLQQRGIYVFELNGISMIAIERDGQFVADPYNVLINDFSEKGYRLIPAMHRFIRETYQGG